MVSHYSLLKTRENKRVKMCMTVGPSNVRLKVNTWQSSYDANSHDNTYLYSWTLSVMSLTNNH